MFQSYKYGFLSLLRSRSQIFWTLMFPIILGTLFFIAFGSIIETTENFSQIPVAVVTKTQSETADNFVKVLNGLSNGEDALITPRYTGLEEAKELLKSGEINGIFQVDDKLKLIVSGEGLNQSILKSVTDSFLQVSGTISNIARTRPDKVNQVIADINRDMKINQEIQLGRGETDTNVQYYYALIAMACLFGCYFGCTKVLGIQANKSALAARRCVSPMKKISMILCDFAAATTFLFLLVLIVIAYLTLVLGINFGSELGFIVLTSFVGCIVGVSFGTFMTAIVKANRNTIEGLLTGSSLFLCFLSGLMFGNMKDIIEQHIPVINRINPAALLSDAFYCLTAYDNYARYTRCMISLLIISAIFCIGSVLVLRRKRYASI